MTLKSSQLESYSLRPLKYEVGVCVSRSVMSDSDHMDCSLPGSYVYGSLQERILELVAMSFSRGSSRARIEPGLLHCRQILYCLSHLGSPKYEGDNINYL